MDTMYTRYIHEQEKKTPVTLRAMNSRQLQYSKAPNLAYWSTSMGGGSETSPCTASPPEG